MHLDKQHPTPVYLQLKEMLRNQIEQGVYCYHQKLPSERDLCQHFKLSRMTARRALKELVDEGLAYTRVGKGTFVGKPNNLSAPPAIKASYSPHLTDKGVSNHQQNLVDRLLSFDCVGTEQIVREILATYPVEIVATKIFPEVILQLEQRCGRGEGCLLAKHYAITTLRSHLFAMVNATITVETGPKVLLACAPEDQDEIDSLLLALFLRRRGFRVIYLGPNVTITGFHQMIETVRPQLVCFTATTPKSALALADLSQQCHINFEMQAKDGKEQMSSAMFAFSGRAFVQNPGLVSKIAGLYLGDTVENSVSRIESMFSQENIS